MTSTISVLQRARQENVRLHPFPYLVVQNALPEKIYRELAQSFPSRTLMSIPEEKNNFRWNYGAKDVAANTSLSTIWRDFIAYHSSGDFFQEVATYLYPGIHQIY